MTTTQDMLVTLQRNVGIIERQTAGLNHDDSVLQLPFQGNCLNWVIGHLVAHRDHMLKASGDTPLWDAADTALYDHGSEPITDGTTAINFERLMADLKTSQTRLQAAFNALTEEQLNTVEAGRDRTLRDRLAFLVWHDTYHTGQTEYLRQLTGVNDKVI